LNQGALPLLLDNTHEEGERIDDDFYETPAWCVEGLLRQTQWVLRGSSVLDPSAGRGAILEAARSFGAQNCNGIELDRDRARRAALAGFMVMLDNALTSRWPLADFLIGNPPYSLALEFASRAALWSRTTGRPAAMLLRLGFMSSKERAPFHLEFPSCLHPLAKRPKFRTDRKGTDKYDVGWFIWYPDGRSCWSPIPHPDQWAEWREVAA
jgi:hypothetical protein